MRSSILTQKRAKALRRAMTQPELELWRLLRRKNLEHLRFRRQHAFGPYILDFYCPSIKLCVEVDGPSHDSSGRASHDAGRDRYLGEQGIRVLRFPVDEVLDPKRIRRVLEAIAQARSPSPVNGGGRKGPFPHPALSYPAPFDTP